MSEQAVSELTTSKRALTNPDRPTSPADSLNPAHVGVYKVDGGYPTTPPWHPSTRYPEYAFDDAIADEPNHVYEAVRGVLKELGYDAAHFDTPDWNPLGELVKPGDTVVLKPNFIRNFHDQPDGDMSCIITQGGVIRAVLDYVLIALKGTGRVAVVDAPQCEASFDEICRMTGLRDIQSFCQDRIGVPIDVIDLRPEYTEKVDGVIIGHRVLPGDPAGYTVINMGRDSEFTAINHLNHRLYGSEYDISEVAAHHRGDTHEYLISRTILDADVFINLPKLKTHKKVGVTLNLKNLVGINGNKNWLPHHLEGLPCNGGDQYASNGISERLEQFLLANFKRHFPKLGAARRHLAGIVKGAGRRTFGDTDTDRIRSGNWHGNDTTWRMVLDLNRALRYGDGEGNLHDTPQRRYFSFVDGIVGGEGNGPMGADAVHSGVIVAGLDPVAVDITCARLMGFDHQHIPTLRSALSPHRYALNRVRFDEIECKSNVSDWTGRIDQWEGRRFGYTAHFGWTGHVEVGSVPEASAPAPPPSPIRQTLGAFGSFLISILVFLIVFGIYAGTATLVAVGRFIRYITFRRFKPRPVGDVHMLLTGTFYNEAWYRSHVLPLTASEGISRIYVITDQPLFHNDKVTYLCPPRWAQRLMGRIAARTYAIFRCAAVCKPDLLMGYHIFPNAILCLIAAAMFGGRTAYQMTGGPVQLIGGGSGCDNTLLRRLNGESWILERLIYHLVRRFDLVVVRGRKALEFVYENRLAKQATIVTGSVDFDLALRQRILPQFDIVMVARHIPTKQPELFVEIARALSRSRPDIRAALVGEGTLTNQLKEQVKRHGLQRNVFFLGRLARVDEVLAASKVFVLTSQSEGLSIAMIEAMAAGLPALVPNVGDLSALLDDGKNGYFIRPEDVDTCAKLIDDLLNDDEKWRAKSQNARDRAMASSSISAIARHWDTLLPDWLNGDGATAARSTEFKRALSRKNLWDATPASVRRAFGRLPSLIPTKYYLGTQFRRNLKFVQEADRWSADQASAYQLERLRRLIEFINEKSSYYRETFKICGFDPGDLKSLDDLRALPLIDKDVVRDRLSEIATIDPSAPHVDLVSTGGTSGVPLRWYFSRDRSATEYAYLVAGWSRVGYRMHIPQVVIRGQIVNPERSGLYHVFDPILRRHYYSNFHMTDANMARYLEHIATIGPCYLHVYPSSVAALARFIDRSGVRVPTNIRGILAGSEIVYDEDRERAERVFGVRYYSWYGHSEKLVMAAECEHSQDYHVFGTYGYFELLDEQGGPITTPGQRGEIVGTGFINELTPFLRYRTGDMATYVGDRCERCGRQCPMIKDIRGHRTQELLVASDCSMISWTALNMHDDTFDRVRQFQFHQDTPGEATLRVVPAEGFGDADIQRILRNMNRKLEHRVSFDIQLVDDIPLTKSGKSTYVDQKIDLESLHDTEVTAT